MFFSAGHLSSPVSTTPFGGQNAINPNDSTFNAKILPYTWLGLHELDIESDSDLVSNEDSAGLEQFNGFASSQ